MSNVFDTALIIIDLMQMMIILFFASKDAEAPAASLLRVVRLFKLLRIVRLLRNEMFRDLMSMIQGIMGGWQTLGWALVLFFIMVYVISLVFRETLGRKEYEHVTNHFDSVPRAIFTTFRCSFGDCSSNGGAPIFAHVFDNYGIFHSAFYCAFTFGMSVGLFNVISAIFVESTMAAAAELELSKKS